MEGAITCRNRKTNKDTGKEEGILSHHVSSVGDWNKYGVW